MPVLYDVLYALSLGVVGGIGCAITLYVLMMLEANHHKAQQDHQNALEQLENDWKAIVDDLKKPCRERVRPPIILLALLTFSLSACSMTRVDVPYLLADGTVYQVVSARTHQDLGHGSEGYLLTAYHCQRETIADGELLQKDQVIHALAYDADGKVFRRDETTVPYKATNCIVDGQSAGGGPTLSSIGLAGVTSTVGLVGAAAVLRPSRTNVEQHGGDAQAEASPTVTAHGGSGGSAHSDSVSKSRSSAAATSKSRAAGRDIVNRPAMPLPCMGGHCD